MPRYVLTYLESDETQTISFFDENYSKALSNVCEAFNIEQDNIISLTEKPLREHSDDSQQIKLYIVTVTSQFGLIDLKVYTDLSEAITARDDLYNIYHTSNNTVSLVTKEVEK